VTEAFAVRDQPAPHRAARPALVAGGALAALVVSCVAAVEALADGRNGAHLAVTNRAESGRRAIEWLVDEQYRVQRGSSAPSTAAPSVTGRVTEPTPQPTTTPSAGVYLGGSGSMSDEAAMTRALWSYNPRPPHARTVISYATAYRDSSAARRRKSRSRSVTDMAATLPTGWLERGLRRS
jgi:hypothetical protein